jgi:hypothetical protein
MPNCANAAALLRNGCPAPGYIVQYRPGVDSLARTAELASKYNFVPLYVYPGPQVPGFFANLSVQAVAGLRCEPDVIVVDENGFLIFPGHNCGT